MATLQPRGGSDRIERLVCAVSGKAQRADEVVGSMEGSGEIEFR